MAVTAWPDPELEIPAFLRRTSTDERTPAMARKKKQTEPETPSNEAANHVDPAAGPGHNSGEAAPKKPADLTEDQRQALAFSHKRQYEAALAKKKAADAEFKNACKRIKAELGDEGVDLIKDMILIATEEGEAKIRAAMERQMRAARYMAAPLGAQFEMFDADRTPAVDRARAEGRRDAMAGEALVNPYDSSVPQADAYAEGWHEGQKAAIEAQKVADGALFDAAEREVEEKGIAGAVADTMRELDAVGDQEPTYQTAH